MRSETQSEKEKSVYAEALRKAAVQYEEMLSDLSAQRLFNDSLRAGMDFNEICHKLVEFLTESTSVENASIMIMDHKRAELRLLVAKGFIEEESAVFDATPWHGKVFQLGEGIAGMVAEGRTSILVNDTDQDPRFVRSDMQRVRIRSLLCIPLMHADHLHGVLNLSNSEPGVFNARKQHVLNVIASTASVALSHALTSRKLRQSNKELAVRNKEMGAIIALSESLHTGLDPEAVLAKSMESLLDAFDVEVAAVYLEDPSTRAVKLKSFKSRMTEPDMKPLLQQLSAGFIRKVIESREPVVRNGPFDKAVAATEHPLAVSICVGVPLLSGNDCLGVLVTFGQNAKKPKKSELGLLRSLSIQISMAVQNSILVSCLRENIKELQETKHKLLQSDKLALLGEMLSGVAHEINNPLTAIRGYSELLSKEESLSKEHHEMTEKILRSADRSRKIIQGLLSFARRTKLEKEEIDITEVIERVIQHREYDLKINNIEVIRDYEENMPVIVADPNQMEQVFLNIVNNAFDSLVTSGAIGKLRIVTRIFEDFWLQIEFIDNGPGIKQSDRNKVFEPFFTTKEVGKGTGLGLSVSYGIIKEHGGDLYVDETYDGGAKFVIRLPAVAMPQATTRPSTEETPSELLEMQGRILVVDDEDDIVDFLHAALSSKGFVVDRVSDGEEAYRMATSTPYDVVISDVRMPGLMDGRRFYDTLSMNRPEIAEHFIFMSGDIMEEETANFLRQSGRGFLLKPFSVHDLYKAVEKTLAGRSQ